MGSPTNVLYLGIRVEDRDANRAITDLNRKLDGVGDHGRRGGDQASRAMAQLRDTLRSTAKVPPPPIPTEKLQQFTAEMQRFKRESSSVFSGFTADARTMGSSLLGLTKGLAGPLAALYSLKEAVSSAIDTAQFAARTEQLGYALNAVARASNLSEEAVESQVAAIEKLGFTQQASRRNMSRMIAANIDYKKATDLARLSQDLGRLANINSTEAYERLTHAIVTLQPEMLRTLGLTVNLERSYRQYAKTTNKSADDLTELERRQVAVNAVLAAGASFHGVYTESAKTAGGQVLSMQRYFDDLKQAVGDRFLPAYTSLVTLMADGLKAAKENIGILDAWARGWEITTIPLQKAAGVFAELIGFVKEYNRVQPRTLDPGNLNDKNQIDRRTAYARAQQASFFNGFGQGLRALFVDMKSLEGDAKAAMQRTLARKIQSTQAAAAAAKAQYEADLEAAEAESEKKRKEFEQQAKQATAQSRGLLEKAQLSELEGLERINRERQIALRDLGLTSEAVRNINAAFNIEVQQENIRQTKLWADTMADAQQAQAKQTGEFMKVQMDALRRRFDFEKEIKLYKLRGEEEGIRSQEIALRQEKELRLAQMEVVASNDLQGKLALEEAKLRIESEYLQRSVELTEAASRKKAEIDIQTNPKFREEIEIGLQDRVAEIRRSAAADQRLNEQRAVNSQQEMVLRAWEDTYDRMKRGAESVFDALTARSKSFGEYLKTGMLTILREIVSSNFARLYMGMFNGGAGQAPSGGAQRGGGIGALLGLPGFGGTGNIALPGAPGGTGGFAGPVGGFGNNGIGSLFGIGSAGRVGSTPSIASGAGAQGGWRGMLAAQGAGFKGVLTSLGNLGGQPVYDMWGQAGTSVGKGVGGMGGGAMLLGGGVLAAAGLQRGGWSGLGMTAAGGALIGAKFGGPIGAVIGGAIGAGAGLFRMLFKGAEKKTQEKIKAHYGIDVKDKGILRQVVETAKSAYGGNADVAIRSPQIRDLLELYAMSTGQKFGLNKDTVRPFIASQSNGNIFQQVQYDAGRAFTQQSSLTTAAAGGKTTVVLQINGESASAALQGQAVEAIVQNPRMVQAAGTSAARGNFQRRQAWIQGIAPQQITS